MPYTVNVKEEMVAKDAALSALADIGDWAPSRFPHIVRAAALILTTDVTAVGVVKFDKRPTAGSNTGRGDGDVAIINLLAAHNQGEVIFKDGLNVLIKPGEEVVAEVTDLTAAAETAHVVLFVEMVPEVPGNNAKMIATT